MPDDIDSPSPQESGEPIDAADAPLESPPPDDAEVTPQASEEAAADEPTMAAESTPNDDDSSETSEPSDASLIDPPAAASDEESSAEPVAASDEAATEAPQAAEAADASDATDATDAGDAADAADDALDWAAAATADKVLAEAMAADAGGSGIAPPASEEAQSDDLLLSQDELNALLGQSEEFAAETSPPATPTPESPEPVAGAESPPPTDLPAPVESLASEPPPGQPAELPEFSLPASAEPVQNNIDLLGDVELAVKIELGRTEMYVEDVLRLGVGSVVELDRLAGDPVDVWVNERLVARGEVLVLNDNFCVRVNEILSPVVETDAEP